MRSTETGKILSIKRWVYLWDSSSCRRQRKSSIPRRKPPRSVHADFFLANRHRPLKAVARLKLGTKLAQGSGL